MVEQPIELVASLAGNGSVSIAEARERFPDGVDPNKALFRLANLGLAFRIAHGRYAVPSKEALSDALAQPQPPIRLAVWLHRWFLDEAARSDLARGLAWDQARFIGLALHRHSQLRWDGPELLVPIQEEAKRLDGLHHSVPILAYDSLEEAQELDLRGTKTLLPRPRDLARILLVHHDPRLQEAGDHLLEHQGSRDEAFDVQLSKTDPPMPFPDARLPRGPPFRYRVFAPRSWIHKNLEHSHPSRARGDR